MIHETVRVHYPLVSMTDALNQDINENQFETKSLLDYFAQFKQNHEIMKVHIGKGVLNYFE